MNGGKEKKLHYAWMVLLGLCGPQFFTVTAWYMTASLYLPYVTKELGVTTTSLALYLTIHGLVMAFATNIVARKISKVNVRGLLAVGNTLICLVFMMMSRFTNVWMWYMAAVFTGICAACVQILVPMLVINNWFVKKAGLANGIFWAAGGLGAVALSPVVSSLLVSAGWRKTYMIMGLTGLIGAVMVFLLVRFKPEEKGLAPYGSEESGDNASKNIYLYGPTEKEAVKTAAFMLTLLVTVCLTLEGSFQSLVPTFTSNIGLLAISGVVMSCYMVGNTIGKFLLPTLVDKLKITGAVSIACAGGIAAGGCLVIAANTGAGSFTFAGGVLLGFAAASMSLIPMIVKAVYGTKDYGKLYSYHQITQTIVGCLSITVYSVIMEGFGVKAPVYVIIIVMAAAVAAVFAAVKNGKSKFDMEKSI